MLARKQLTRRPFTVSDGFSPERTATLNTDKDFAYEIRTIQWRRGFHRKPARLSPASSPFCQDRRGADPAQYGRGLRKDWIASVKDFVSRPDQPAKYHSVVKFAHPETGRTAEEWFAAKRDQIVAHDTQTRRARRRS